MRTYGKVFKRKISAKETWGGQRDEKKKCKGIHGTKMFNHLIRNNRNMSKITNTTLLFSVIHHLYIYIQKLVKYFTNPAINNHNWGRWVLTLWLM